MQFQSRLAARAAGVLALALLLCTPLVAQTHVSQQGKITNIVPDGTQYRVTLDNGTYMYSVPRFMVTDRNLRVGDMVKFDGSAMNGVVTVDNTSLIANHQPMNAAYGTPNLTATVDSVNRRLNYIQAHDDSGRKVKIDVRDMDTRRSLNVWNLRAGDRVAVNGEWGNRNTFRATNVNVWNQPMTSSYGSVMNGVVQNVNRNLKYITVRNTQTGQVMKVDVRNLDARQSINVWNLRNGDRITFDGTWENRDTFQANRVNF